MSRFFVADVGNSRIKCGYYDGQSLRCKTILEGASTPSINFWCESYFLRADEASRLPWIVSAVSPNLRDKFMAGLTNAGFEVVSLSDYRRIPIKVDVEFPERVGIDRLLSALAVSQRVSAGHAAAIISAGTAVTVDLVDAHATFCGGVIFPGFRLMAQSLNEHTAQLPLVTEFDATTVIPAKNTESAICSGICAAISGGIDRVVEQYRWTSSPLKAYLTGGDAGLLKTMTCNPAAVDNLVLVGLVLAAKSWK
jgi:type III pantothenate kinase